MNPAVALRTIKAGRYYWPIDPRVIWRAREVFYRLFLREMQVRYRQTTLGFLWAWLQPAIGMAIFTVVFGRMAKMPSDGVPYSVFALLGLVVWTTFSNSLIHGAVTFAENRELICRTAFPRALIPLSVLTSKLIDLLIGFALLAIWTAFVFPVAIQWGWLNALPPLVLLTVFTLGIVLFFSALCVRYRDFRYLIPFLTQIWFFATPIVYPLSIGGAKGAWLFYCNPLAVWVTAIRAALLGTPAVPYTVFVLSAVISMLCLILGAAYFRSMERTFADIL